MKPYPRDYGLKGEQTAVEYLTKKKYKILEQNFTSYGGEIDIIAQATDTTIVFVEVKTYNHSWIHPLEMIHQKKQANIRKTAQFYILKKAQHLDVPYRFDAIVVKNNAVQQHLENIF